MGNADDFDHAIGGDPVDDDVSRLADALFRVHEAAAQAERVNTDTGDLWDGLMAGQGRVIADDVERGPNQQVIAPGGVNAPLSGALKQDAVDVVLGAGEKAIAHRPWASSANRERSRVIALSWSAWLSSGVATVT